MARKIEVFANSLIRQNTPDILCMFTYSFSDWSFGFTDIHLFTFGAFK